MSRQGNAATSRIRGAKPRFLALVAMLLLAGCAARVARPPSETVRPRPKPGYQRRVDELKSLDASALTGRRIAIDPGHGGLFRGALGVNGLTEAEVNLGVALYLRGLLEARGALVFLTRTDDRDFLTPQDSSLRADLSERTRLANAFRPDLFLSVHHNADAGGAHDVNEIQTYYKLGDEGPSLDAAQSVHRYLVRNLGIETHRILPGNYYVLRNSEAPGLLTESSYITNPDVEAKLALAAKQRLEAEALFLGLVHFFARRAPVVEALEAVAPDRAAPDTVFSGIAAPVLHARIAGAFDEYALTLDGTALAGVRRGSELTWRPQPLAAGRHEAALRVHLAGRGAAPERRLAFTMMREPAEIYFERGSPPVGPEGGIVALRLRVEDDGGQLWRDSAWVRIVADDRTRVSPSDTVVIARDGIAWAYLRLSPRPPPSPLLRVRPPAPFVYVRAWLVPRDRPGFEGDEAEVKRWSLSRLNEPRDPRVWLGFVRRMPGDSGLTEAPGTREPSPPIGWLNRDGFAVLERDSSGGVTPPTLPGYRPWAGDSLPPPRFVPIAGGALHGRKIVIDPDGGGENPAGTGRSGTRAASLNLEVARALAGLLTAAGAEARLTRTGDFALSEVERVQISEAFHADRFLRIGHRADAPRLGYYFSSPNGKRWAQATARELARLGLAAPRLAEDAQYPLQQTSCPALFVSTARVDEPASEERLLAPGALRAEAYALYLALAREWAADAVWPIDSLEVQDADGKPVAGAAVVLGESLVLETDARGRARFARTEPGPLEAEVLHPRLRHRQLLLDSTRGVIVTGLSGP